MVFDPNRPDLTLGVIGAGAMGRGIAQVAATGGISVLMTDARPGVAQEARDFISKMLARAAEKGTMTPADADAAVNRIQTVDALADFKDCHVVIEAIVENLDAKRALFTALDFDVVPLKPGAAGPDYAVVRADHGDANPLWPFLSDIEAALFVAFVFATVAGLLWPHKPRS